LIMSMNNIIIPKLQYFFLNPEALATHKDSSMALAFCIFGSYRERSFSGRITRYYSEVAICFFESRGTSEA
jgi:hypothetical protein